MLKFWKKFKKNNFREKQFLSLSNYTFFLENFLKKEMFFSYLVYMHSLKADMVLAEKQLEELDRELKIEHKWQVWHVMTFDDVIVSKKVVRRKKGEKVAEKVVCIHR